MATISKKQRVALREITDLSKKRRNDQIWAIGAIAVMALLIVIYNTLVYSMGVVDEGNYVIRAILYVSAMVAAGLSGIKLMNASKKQRKIDGFRQSAGISRETMEAFKRGEIE